MMDEGAGENTAFFGAQSCSVAECFSEAQPGQGGDGSCSPLRAESGGRKSRKNWCFRIFQRAEDLGTFETGREAPRLEGFWLQGYVIFGLSVVESYLDLMVDRVKGQVGLGKEGGKVAFKNSLGQVAYSIRSAKKSEKREEIETLIPPPRNLLQWEVRRNKIIVLL
ncbi:hypothetical protein NDU88_003843 [Pleurodeles waltl]|uniref:Uncharacterized protein n=1 Tax=Pleurodeles waltl TaxID=8319 RepID=A0AAV7NI60_PLEWA|nr:hypothetical protein NDU88_003843 [Pleurodeles waltl]